MPRPSKDTTTPRPDLGLMAMEYSLEASQRGFIAPIVMPIFQSGLAASTYPYLPISELLRLADTRRAPRAAYARGDWQWKDKGFGTREYGFEEPIDETERKLYQGLYRGLDVEEISTQIAVDTMLRAFEKRVADLVMDEARFTPHNVTAAWDVPESCDPRADVKAGIKEIRTNTGLLPNILIMTRSIFEEVEESQAFLDHVKYTRAILTEAEESRKAAMATYLKVDRILLANSIHNQSKKQGVADLVSIWPDNFAMLARVATQPQNLKEACLGRTFLWTGMAADFLPVEEYYEPQTKSDIIRVSHHTDEKFVFEACGYLLKGLETPEG
jgi:hypothetical protein